MAISVDTLYKLVNNDLAGLGRSGYTDNDQFNRMVNLAQVMMLEFYHNQYRVTNNIADAVRPFYVPDEKISITQGTGTLPGNYAHGLAVTTLQAIGCDGGTPRVGATELLPHEKWAVIHDPLVGASLNNPYYELSSEGIRVWPIAITKVELAYLRQPTDAERAITTGANDTETLDEANTTDLEWPATETGDFVSILLAMKGIQVRDSEIATFVANRFVNVIQQQ